MASRWPGWRGCGGWSWRFLYLTAFDLPAEEAEGKIIRKPVPLELLVLETRRALAGKVLTHRFILREVWGGDTDVQYPRVYIRSLRQKIESDLERPRHILTETGVGYRLRAPDWDAATAQSSG
jgi:DNA-binding response OmpR family regulator